MFKKIDEDQIAVIDQHLRQGRVELAAKDLRAMTSRKIARPLALRLAALSRRANLLTLALRLLNPIVRPPPKSPVDATDAEKAEYASSLALLGLSEEALTILEALDSEKLPETLLYQSFALVSQWNYEVTISLLKKYVASPAITPYQKLVGKVNLAAALVHERHVQEASSCLEEIREETKRDKLHRLYGNTLELSAQNAINEGKWSEGQAFLDESGKTLEGMQTLDAFFVRKWKCILELLRTKGATTALRDLHQVRSDAVKLHHWETARDCDQFEAVTLKNENILVFLYHGTPFESFRKKLLADFGEQLLIPEEFDWHLDKEMTTGQNIERKATNSEPKLRLLTGKISPGTGTIKPGHNLRRLLLTLASDFYRPFRVPSLYSRVYPDEFYNPVSSPLRIHQLTKRLRQWLSKSAFPVLVNEYNGFYFLTSKKPCTIQLTLSRPGFERDAYLLRQLLGRWPEGQFSVKQAKGFLKSSQSSLHRLLRKAQQENKIEKFGKGNATRYSFKRGNTG